MNIYKTNLFPHLQGDHIPKGNTVNLTMTGVKSESLKNMRGQEEEKYVLGFRETPKTLILNKTNARTIAKLYGPETDGWNGQRIKIYSEEVRAFGETHNTVRVSPTIPPANGTNGNAQPATPDEPMPQPQAEQAAMADSEAEAEDEEADEEEYYASETTDNEYSHIYRGDALR